MPQKSAPHRLANRASADFCAFTILFCALFIVLARCLEYWIHVRANKNKRPIRAAGTHEVRKVDAQAGKQKPEQANRRDKASNEQPGSGTEANEDAEMEELRQLEQELKDFESEVAKMEAMVEEHGKMHPESQGSAGRHSGQGAPAPPDHSTGRPGGRGRSGKGGGTNTNQKGEEQGTKAMDEPPSQAKDFLTSRFADTYLRYRGTKKPDGSWATD